MLGDIEGEIKRNNKQTYIHTRTVHVYKIQRRRRRTNKQKKTDRNASE